MKMSVAMPAAAAAVLLVVLAIEWLPAGATAVRVAPPNLHPRGAASEPDSVAKDTEGWARSIVARPVFAISRRPPKLAGGKSAVASTGLPRLSGHHDQPGGQAGRSSCPRAAMRRRLARAATLDDYRISQISADRVTLTGAKGEIVLRPAYDGARAAGGPGEMGQPGFQPPGFQPPGFNPGFRPPGFPGMPPPPPPVVNNAPDDDSADDATPAQPVAPQPFPGFRGPFIPRGRNNE